MPKATLAGNQKVPACQEPNQAIPTAAIGPIKAPPTLWATFQIDIFVPRSCCENQCVITRPLGGQPIP